MMNGIDMGRVIIGANGYVGRHVCQAYADAGLPFTMTTRGEGLDVKASFPGAEVIRRFSLADTSTYELVNDFRTFVILASASVPSTFADSLRDEVAHNLLPFIDFLDFVPVGSRVIYVSSGGTVYGNAGAAGGLLSEAQRPEPISPYGLVKSMIEETIRYHARRRDIDYVILRPSNPVGPEISVEGGEVRRRPQGAVTIFLRKILAGDPITVFGDGLNERDYFDVRDLGRAIVAVDRARDVRDVTLNVGSGDGTALNALIEQIGEVAGCPVHIDRHPVRGFDVQRVVLDIAPIRELTGWSPTIPLKQSIVDTRDWLKD